jgi:hypothetical protein
MTTVMMIVMTMMNKGDGHDDGRERDEDDYDDLMMI